MLKIKLIFRLFGEIMKRLSKFCILSIILIILSISAVSASEVDNDNIQSSIDDTDSLAGKKELTKVMNEQLGILEK